MFNEILIENKDEILECLRKQICSSQKNPEYEYEAKEGSLLERLHNYGKDIQEKTFGNISSFNFSRDVFFCGKWNEMTTKARGLFLDNTSGKIVARGFEKFFAYKEGRFNTPEWLEKNLKFPVMAYAKYNGFLGILGHNESGLLFCSKSTLGGDYAENFKRIFHKHDHFENKLLECMRRQNIGLAFEVIDPVNDPHIVEYETEGITLLDAICLDENFKSISFELLENIAHEFNFRVKKMECRFNDWNSLKKFLDEQGKNMKDHKEGYVLVDSNNYHFKLKTAWYKFWKFMRTMKDKIAFGRQFRISGISDPKAIGMIGWMKRQDEEWLKSASIIQVRNRYEKELTDNASDSL